MLLLAAEEAKALCIAWVHHVDGYGSLPCWLHNASSNGSVGVYSWEGKEPDTSHSLISGVMWPPDYFPLCVLWGVSHNPTLAKWPV